MNPIRVIILDDEPDDARLIQRQLEKLDNPVEVRLTTSEREYRQSLDDFPPDIILADYKLPSFTGLQALKFLHQTGHDIPFIIISGTIGEEKAVEIMRLGAADYIMKDNLTRLVEVIRRELREAENRKQQREDQHKLIQSELEKKLILDNTSELFVLHDPALTIKWANKAAADSLNMKPENLVGRHCYELWQERNKPCEDCPVLASLKSMNTEGTEKQVPDGRIFRLHAYPIFDQEGRQIATAQYGRDITLEKKIEKEIIQAKEKAEESEKLKNIFLANMSHEIRTPLNGIIGFTDLMKDHSLQNEQRDEFLSVIDNSAHNLLGLINDLLEFSSLEVRRIKLEPRSTNLDEFIDQILEEFRINPINGKSAIELIKNRMPMAWSPVCCFDPIRLRQVITNLINNAYKFTEKGHIELGYGIGKDKRIQFYLQDTGIGIPQDAQIYIFDSFRQGDEGYTKTYGGAGLGLAICRSLLNYMEGDISVESQEGKGSIFRFSIPWHPGETTAEQNNTACAGLNETLMKDKHILVAEDVLTNYILIETMLKGRCAKISRAENGQQVLDALEAEVPDLILMDIKMPVMDGIEAFKELRSRGLTLPVIALTAYAMNEEKQQIIEAGFDGYLSKPFNRNDLLNLIQTSLTDA